MTTVCLDLDFCPAPLKLLALKICNTLAVYLASGGNGFGVSDYGKQRTMKLLLLQPLQLLLGCQKKDTF